MDVTMQVYSCILDKTIENICACIINIKVPHEVKDQRALAKRTSQIM